jgi:hypothetical protein
MLLRLDPLEGENVRASRAMTKASAPRSYANEVVLAVYAAIVAIAFLVTPKIWPATAGAGVFGAGLVIVAVAREAKWRARRARARDIHALEPWQIEVNAAGIRTWCDHIDLRHTWSGITRVIETPEFFLFLRGPNGGPVIPKRILDAALTSELRANVRDWSPDHGASLQTA